MNEDMDNRVDSECDLETSASERLSGITSPVLWPIGKSFLRNIHDLQALLVMPRMLYGFTSVVRHMMNLVLEYLTTGQHVNKDTRQVIEEVFERLSAFANNQQTVADLSSKSVREFDEKILSHPSYGPMLISSQKVLRSAVVSASWTALECIAADCWVAALNTSPIPLAQRALSSIPEEPQEISSKQIPVGLAAKYNFDLRNCLGTILRSKFDFTSVSGMKKAFKAAFSDNNELIDILSKPLLCDLEISRHLIVHRAGIVDEEYNRRTSANFSIGNTLELDDQRVREFAECAGFTGSAVLLFVDEWLVANSGKN